MTDSRKRHRRAEKAERIDAPATPPRDTYHLTAAGLELVPVLAALTAWGDKWVAPKQGPPLRLQHRGCGKFFTPTVSCSACGEALAANDLVAHPGPGGRAGPGTRLVGTVLGKRPLALDSRPRERQTRGG